MTDQGRATDREQRALRKWRPSRDLLSIGRAILILWVYPRHWVLVPRRQTASSGRLTYWTWFCLTLEWERQ